MRTFRYISMSICISALALGTTGCVYSADDEVVGKKVDPASEWEAIFNGKNLDGWTVNLAGQSVGTDPYNTFSVRDSKIVVSYEDYDAFDGQFGHLFFDTELSHYKLRLEYRFVGEPMKDAPVWAKFNSGVMLHSQPPSSMKNDQGFPASIEAQFLALSNAAEDRTTANFCTPGTKVSFEGVVNENHCINSNTPALPVGDWVVFEAHVKGSEFITLSINGQQAMKVTELMWNPEEDFGGGYAAPGNVASSGFIALQAESQPIEFRNIQIKDLSMITQ